MIGYAELNEAFRHFKEFGNTVIFLNLMESALVMVSTLHLGSSFFTDIFHAYSVWWTTKFSCRPHLSWELIHQT